MVELFPSSAGITQVRGVIKIVKDNGGSMGIAELADEAEEEIDDLFPILDACKLLKLLEVKDGKVKLAYTLENADARGISKVIKSRLQDIEPFKTVLMALKIEGDSNTGRLVNALQSNNILLFDDERKSAEALRKMLVKWAVRVKLLVYEQGSDSWKLA